MILKVIVNYKANLSYGFDQLFWQNAEIRICFCFEYGELPAEPMDSGRAIFQVAAVLSNIMVETVI